MKEVRGLYSSDGSFRTDDQIKRELALNGDLPSFQTPINFPLTADEYLAQAQELTRLHKETAPQSDNFVEVTIPSNSLLALWGDLHLFNENTDIDRVRAELEVITHTKNIYVVAGADLIDGIHWGGEGGGEQTASITHQTTVMRSIFKSLEGRVIVGVSGEHDSKWAMRTGADPYAQFSEQTGAPYVKGTGEVLIHCGDYDYKMVVAHKMKGFSIHNPNHPGARNSRFGIQGADLYVNLHNHDKGDSRIIIRSFNDVRIVTLVACGAYKPTDGYLAREGFAKQKVKQMYGQAIYLPGDSDNIEVDPDILHAVKKWL